jgi:hypothetical protein
VWFSRDGSTDVEIAEILIMNGKKITCFEV